MTFPSFNQASSALIKMLETEGLFSLLLLLLLVENTACLCSIKKVVQFNDCESYEKDIERTLCRELRDYEDTKSAFQILQAEGSVCMKNKLYPEHKPFETALIGFDEPLYPIPVGASVYFVFIISVLALWYMIAFCNYAFYDVKKELNLHPQTAKFPFLPLYWLQQSKRELSLRREFRNTWAWLAKRYLLHPEDPLVGDIDEVMGRTTWSDFNVTRNTWSLIEATLRHNYLYVGVKEDSEGNLNYVIKKEKNKNAHGRLNINLLLKGIKSNNGTPDKSLKKLKSLKVIVGERASVGNVLPKASTGYLKIKDKSIKTGVPHRGVAFDEDALKKRTTKKTGPRNNERRKKRTSETKVKVKSPTFQSAIEAEGSGDDAGKSYEPTRSNSRLHRTKKKAGEQPSGLRLEKSKFKDYKSKRSKSLQVQEIQNMIDEYNKKKSLAVTDQPIQLQNQVDQIDTPALQGPDP